MEPLLMGSKSGANFNNRCSIGSTLFFLFYPAILCCGQTTGEIRRIGGATDLAIIDLNTSSQETLSFIISAEAGGSGIFLNTKAGVNYLESIGAVLGDAVPEKTAVKLREPLQHEDRPLPDEVASLINFPGAVEQYPSMDAMVGVVALRSLPYPIVIFNNSKRSVEFADTLPQIKVRRNFQLFSESAGAYCLAIRMGGENWLFKITSTGHTDCSFSFPLIAQLASMKRKGNSESLQLADTPIKATTKVSHEMENSVRIFAMDSDQVIIDKSTMTLILAD